MPTINTTPYTLVHVDGYGRVITGTNLEFIEGDVRGIITDSTVTLNLRSIGLTPGTYGGNIAIPQITVNNKGIITAISNVDSAFRNYREVKKIVSGKSLRPKVKLKAPSWISNN